MSEGWHDFVPEKYQVERLAVGARELLDSAEVRAVITIMKQHLHKVLLSAETQEEEHKIVDRLRAIEDLNRGLKKMAHIKESK